MIRSVWSDVPTRARIGFGFLLAGGLVAQFGGGLFFAYALTACGIYLCVLALGELL